jgi:hypothetical protein
MSELRRLLDDEATADEARLLRAAADDGWSPKAKDRVASALVGAGVMTAAGASAATGAAVGHAVGRAGLAWLGRLLVSAATIVGGASLVLRPVEEVASSASAPSGAPSSLASGEPRVQPSEEPAATPKGPSDSPMPSASVAAQAPKHDSSGSDAHPASSASLSDQLAVIDTAREEVRSHRPGEALATLDRYAKSYPRGAFGPEAMLVRIEALLALGQRPEAVRLAHQFLDRAPGSPYARRVRSLIGEP